MKQPEITRKPHKMHMLFLFFQEALIGLASTGHYKSASSRAALFASRNSLQLSLTNRLSNPPEVLRFSRSSQHICPSPVQLARLLASSESGTLEDHQLGQRLSCCIDLTLQETSNPVANCWNFLWWHKLLQSILVPLVPLHLWFSPIWWAHPWDHRGAWQCCRCLQLWDWPQEDLLPNHPDCSPQVESRPETSWQCDAAARFGYLVCQHWICPKRCSGHWCLQSQRTRFDNELGRRRNKFSRSRRRHRKWYAPNEDSIGEGAKRRHIGSVSHPTHISPWLPLQLHPPSVQCYSCWKTSWEAQASPSFFEPFELHRLQWDLLRMSQFHGIPNRWIPVASSWPLGWLCWWSPPGLVHWVRSNWHYGHLGQHRRHGRCIRCYRSPHISAPSQQCPPLGGNHWPSSRRWSIVPGVKSYVPRHIQPMALETNRDEFRLPHENLRHPKSDPSTRAWPNG